MQLVTAHDAADTLRISVDGVYRLLRRGDIPAVRVGIRSIRIPEDAVDAYIAEHTDQAEA